MQKMELDELNQLEKKIRNLVNTLKLLKDENKNLQLQLEQLKKESSGNNEERLEIKKKVTTLLELIDSIEK